MSPSPNLQPHSSSKPSAPKLERTRRTRDDAATQGKRRQEEFGKKVSAIRQQKKLGARELSRIADLSHVQVLNIESGKRLAGIGAAVKLTGALGLTANERAKILHDYLGWHGGHIITGLLAEALKSAGLSASIRGTSQIEVDLGGGLKVEADLTW